MDIFKLSLKRKEHLKSLVTDVLKENNLKYSEDEIEKILEEVLNTSYKIGGSCRDEVIREILSTYIDKNLPLF